jgi:hypothetical protein
MNLGRKTVDEIVTVTQRTRLVLLLSSCLLFAGASLAQTKFEPIHAMAPAQLQRAMFISGPSLPAAKTTESKAVQRATTAKGTHEGTHVHGYWKIEVRTLSCSGNVAEKELDHAANRALRPR